MPGPALVQTFLRYRRRVRVGVLGLLPISSEKYPTLTGWPGNVMHDTDLYQSLIPFLEGQNADGAVFSLTGERLTAALPVASGHAHDTDVTALPWWPIGSWQMPSNRTEPFSAATITVNAVINSTLAIFLGTVQPGTTRIAVRACITGPIGAGAALWFMLTFNIYGDNNLASDALVTQLVWDLSVDHVEHWLETQPIDISVLSFTADRQIICAVTFSFDVGAGAPAIAVHQVLLGALDR